MANTIRHKRGTTTPAAGSLVTGEIAINTATGVAFTKTDGGTVVALGGGISLADLGNGNATAGALVLDALDNSNAPSATNPFATEGDLNSAVTAFSAQIGACRAWVNFNGTGTIAIRAALNVSSITDNGVGDYTVNFTTALADANYAVCALSNWDATSRGALMGINQLRTKTASALPVSTLQSANYTALDVTEVTVAAFR